jgi:hypothetical protein
MQRSNLASGDYESVKPFQTNGSTLKHQSDMPPPPVPPPWNTSFNGKAKPPVPVARADIDEIFVIQNSVCSKAPRHMMCELTLVYHRIQGSCQM